MFIYGGFHKYVSIDSHPFIFLVSRRMISFRSGSCLSKLERVKENIIKVPQWAKKNHISALYSSSDGHVRYYALLVASSCRSKRNYPAAATERYFDNCYKDILDFFMKPP